MQVGYAVTDNTPSLAHFYSVSSDESELVNLLLETRPFISLNSNHSGMINGAKLISHSTLRSTYYFSFFPGWKSECVHRLGRRVKKTTETDSSRRRMAENKHRKKQIKREIGRSFNRTKAVRGSRSVLMTDEGMCINNGKWSGIEFYLFRTALSPLYLSHTFILEEQRDNKLFRTRFFRYSEENVTAACRHILKVNWEVARLL